MGPDRPAVQTQVASRVAKMFVSIDLLFEAVDVESAQGQTFLEAAEARKRS